MAAVVAKASVGPGCPVWVAGEDLIVVDGAQEANDTQLENQGVDDLLGVFLGDDASGEVALEVAIEEGGQAADGHCGAILGLNGSQVAKVGPLHCLVSGLSRLGDVEAVGLSHLLELLQGLDLLGVLLAEACPVLREASICDGIAGSLLFLNQVVHTVQCDTAVVADDAASAVSIRQAGDDV